APYNRFALARFTEDPAEALTRAYLSRALARWVSYLVPLPFGALVGRLAPAALVSGSLGRPALGSQPRRARGRDGRAARPAPGAAGAARRDAVPARRRALRHPRPRRAR